MSALIWKTFITNIARTLKAIFAHSRGNSSGIFIIDHDIRTRYQRGFFSKRGSRLSEHKRRRWSKEQKFKVALAAIRGNKTIA